MSWNELTAHKSVTDAPLEIRLRLLYPAQGTLACQITVHVKVTKLEYQETFRKSDESKYRRPHVEGQKLVVILQLNVNYIRNNCLNACKGYNHVGLEKKQIDICIHGH